MSKRVIIEYYDSDDKTAEGWNCMNLGVFIDSLRMYLQRTNQETWIKLESAFKTGEKDDMLYLGGKSNALDDAMDWIEKVEYCHKKKD